MLSRRLSDVRWLLHAAALACVACLVAGTGNAVAVNSASTGLTVHEWGTFTIVVGPDGVPARWRPLQVNGDLPEFVESRERNGKTEIIGTVRMETPVIYFYAGRDMKLSVSVDFPAGRITEWYPSASVPVNAETIAWNDVLIQPGSEEVYPKATESSHYYAARETDAAPIVVTTDDGRTQREKLLFYRGVGTFDLPLAASIEGGNISLKSRGRAPSDAIVVECRDGKIGFVEVDLSSGASSVARPTPDEGGTARLRSHLGARLEAAGLYPREAAAMIATWGDTWTEDGLRVFFIVPRSATNEILPLRVRPVPDAIERVLLGRIEIVRPETEAAVSAMALEFANPDGPRAKSLAKLRALGHFFEPIIKIVAIRNGDGPVSRALHEAVPEVFRDY